ncbi:mediator of RNA polymerase II transcription subunit 6 [Agrilus planipennis]|uniref:Mediator of RNA polymerase II transcription subunit 6 n=1 Tax=Agrilus planipennis TaxID=224129 RepID=A0A7F5RCR1_AGRPL|nr:mediator of RNA polymerase II transcription subunit 6 [Agrilus planipennis]XP_025833757.1 mediator of RNA polymerase II transcription subunit 6 [Agrilus planipennis]
MMIPSRLGLTPGIPDHPLCTSWHDSAWIPILNTGNVMDYFSERSNPFFDRTCNNEIVKMQRLNPDQLQNMTGLEYVLLHVQEPILYVIRKQHRHSPTQVVPFADYYIIAGIIYQAPDLATVLNSRLLSAVHHLQSAFEEASSYARYHPSKGYSWDFKRSGIDKVKKEEKPKEEASSLFQRQRVDMLLGELIKKFPLPQPQLPKINPTAVVKTEPENGTTENKESKSDKQEKIKPPPEKKPKIN